jgi:6-phosphogluconolactonase
VKLSEAEIYPDAEHLAEAGAQHLLERAHHAFTLHDAFHVALAGGHTPAALYRRLAAHADGSDWSKWHVYFGDERCVPPDDLQSNYRMAREAMLDALPIPFEQIHPMVNHPEAPARDAAAYAELLTTLPQAEGWPVFDLILLGIGPDGHTASLFPDSTLLAETEQSVVAGFVPQQRMNRVSLTRPVLEHARELAFLVCGAEKAPVIGAIERGEHRNYPVQQLAPRGRVSWWLDAAAAEEIRS